MKADFLFAGLSLKRIILIKKYQKKAHLMHDALKTRAIIY